MASTKNFGQRSRSVTKSNFASTSDNYTQDLGLNKYIQDVLDKHMLANHTIEEEDKRGEGEAEGEEEKQMINAESTQLLPDQDQIILHQDKSQPSLGKSPGLKSQRMPSKIDMSSLLPSMFKITRKKSPKVQ